MRWNHVMLICILAVPLAACMPRQAIKYSMDDVTILSASPFEKAILAVKSFEDSRKPLTTDCPKMDVSQIKKGDKSFYYNCDNFYKTDSVTREITGMIVSHLKQSHIFKEVLLVDTPPSNADYLLTGKVSRFDGLKERSVGAVVAAQFGLLGALVNLARDNAYEGTTVFDDVRLISLKDNSVIWNSNIIGHIEGSDTVDPYGWSCYWKANLSLKEANTNLLNSLAKQDMSLMLPAKPQEVKKQQSQTNGGIVVSTTE